MEPLERVLAGRDGRAFIQRRMIERSGQVIQVSLNIPGFPKRLPGHRSLVLGVSKILLKRTGVKGHFPVCSVFLDNGAGCADLLEFSGLDPRTAKIIGLELEDLPWGGVLDIDVIGRSGAIHRKELGREERKCLVCNSPAKFCAREMRHAPDSLRERSALLIKRGLKDISGY